MYLAATVICALLTAATATFRRNVTCYSCMPSNTTGCRSGSCVGDYCIDSVQVGGRAPYFARGCYSITNGRNVFETINGYACMTYSIGTTVRSVCACNDGDFCLNGNMVTEPTVPHKPFELHRCMCNDGDSTRFCSAPGELCIKSNMGLQGQLTTDKTNKFDFRLFGFPQNEVGCTLVPGHESSSVGKICLCNTDDCNQNKFLSERKDPQLDIICNDTVHGTCRGGACTYSLSVKENSVQEFRSCITDTNEDGATIQSYGYCDEQVTADTQISCVCTDPMCNRNLMTARKSVDSKVRCSLCDGDSCNGSMCQGDMCLKVGSADGEKRGCYKYLAGVESASGKASDCLTTDLDGKVDKRCTCSDRNDCFSGPASRYTEEEQKSVTCSSGLNQTCVGDRCITSQGARGCVTYPESTSYIDFRFPPKSSPDLCLTVNGAKTCTCTSNCTPPHNARYIDLSTASNDVICVSSTGSCRGAACYYKEINGKIIQDCVTESDSTTNGPLKTTTDYVILACVETTLVGSIERECVCAQDNCNVNLTIAKNAFNFQPTTSSSTQSTTTTTTKAPTSTATTQGTSTSTRQATSSTITSTASPHSASTTKIPTKALSSSISTLSSKTTTYSQPPVTTSKPFVSSRRTTVRSTTTTPRRITTPTTTKPSNHGKPADAAMPIRTLTIAITFLAFRLL